MTAAPEFVRQLASVCSDDDPTRPLHFRCVHVVDSSVLGQRIAFATDGMRAHLMLHVDAPLGSYAARDDGAPVADVRPPPIDHVIPGTDGAPLQLPDADLLDSWCDYWRRDFVACDFESGQLIARRPRPPAAQEKKWKRLTAARQTAARAPYRQTWSMPAGIDPVPLAAAFNARYLRDAMAWCYSCEIAFGGGPLDPVRLDSPDRVAIVMPVQT